jgi:hypothetical protein
MTASRSEAPSTSILLGLRAERRKPRQIRVAARIGTEELVRRLEAENLELRTRAINLALQIQALQEAGAQTTR